MCIFLFDGRVGSLGGREWGDQAEKKGFRFKRNGLPIELESDSIPGPKSVSPEDNTGIISVNSAHAQIKRNVLFHFVDR